MKLPSSLTQIAQGAFRNCKELSNISIPTGVTEIEAEVF
ncbi:MAG: leucine-rich repeat domain-containing protein [Ruminococcus sp.]|nr:leucine-rich repeat domain-containing protein [Ruminococcus sp.]